MEMSEPSFRSRVGAIVAVLLTVAATARAATPDYEQPPIQYSTTQPHDPAARLKRSIDNGSVTLAHDERHGYLGAVLRELKIPASSQTLVFSKTSFQAARISPARPRAVYFNDDTYVGYVPGSDMIEIASSDPTLGAVFYTIPQTERQTPQLIRQTDNCLQCHGESMTRGVPGLLVRSVFADEYGLPIGSAGTFITTQESPLSERWGGWYVTGSTGEKSPHMGNMRWKEPANGSGAVPTPIATASGGTTALPAEVDASEYLTPHSDVVALMVLEHQAEAHNRFTRAAQGTLRALRDEKIMADALGENLEPGKHSESTLGRIKSSCEPLVEYLLFSGETKLTEPVVGSSTFAADFSARGPRDARGRSLRDFDLCTRMFKYPCSYLVYSKSMRGLPGAARDYVDRRLREVLSGVDASERFAHLSPADRVAILEILRETVPAWRDVR
jgi:hypothetical protein